jgi:hypothetical protein
MGHRYLQNWLFTDGFRTINLIGQTVLSHKYKWCMMQLTPTMQLLGSTKQNKLGAYHLEESQVSDEHVVEVDLGLVPGVVEMRQRGTGRVVWNDRGVDQVSIGVDATREPTTEQIHSHDAEDEPEDETDEQHVEDGWNGLDQRVDDHL